MLRDGVRAHGRVIGIDYTEAMLRRARLKARRKGWDNVVFLRLDAARLSTEALGHGGLLTSGEKADATICTLALSVILAWGEAYRAMLDLVRPGGRVAIMDAGYPADRGSAGESVALRPFWWLACRVALNQPQRRPWLRLLSDLDDAVMEYFAGGYVGVTAGTVRP
jgi:SAM-dependent methyltransferase